MQILHVLAAIPVSDIEAGEQWYQRLFGAPPSNNPMPSLVEWRVTDSGWDQVFLNDEKAGSGFANLAVGDLAAAIAELTARGLTPGEIQEVNKGVQLSSLTDPDGNTITLIGGFRAVY